MRNNITGLQHIGIPCKNIEETAKFYEKLGFTRAFETVNNGQNVCFLKLKDLIIETYQEEIIGKSGAINHFCLDVKDIDKAFSEAKDMKLSMCENRITFLPFWENGVRFFAVTGPNNERIEFCQIM